MERVDSASYVIDSTEDINNVMSKSMLGTGKVENAQISVDEVLELSAGSFAALKDVFHSEQVSADYLK